MPDFRFTVHGGTKETRAKVETLDSLAEAKARAVDYASELLRKMDGAFWQDGRLQLDVSDTSALRLCTILIVGLKTPSPGARLPLLHRGGIRASNKPSIALRKQAAHYCKMARYFIHFSGRDRDSVGGEFDSSDEARDHAVAELGALLAREPGYASIGHWKVDVEDDLRRPVVHVMVATITPRRLRLDESDVD